MWLMSEDNFTVIENTSLLPLFAKELKENNLG